MSIFLKVANNKKDNDRGIVRIDEYSINAIGVAAGDLVSLCGKTSTVAKCLLHDTYETQRGVIMMDEVMRHNAIVDVDDPVLIEKAQEVEAKKVTVFPINQKRKLESKYLAESFEGIPISDRCVISFVYFDEIKYFRVERIKPVNANVITDKTIITCKKYRPNSDVFARGL